MGAEERIRELGITLPAPVAPLANYVRWVQTGNLLFISGTGPGQETESGKLGSTMSVEEGYAAARDVGLQLLATARAALGDLNRVQRVVKVLGMVNCTPDFGEHPRVINGCSDLLVEVFGEAGRHTRSAVGFVSLPNQIPVEIEYTWKSHSNGLSRSVALRDMKRASSIRRSAVNTRKVPVTRDGLERLRTELQELRDVRRPAIVAALAEARSHGDLRENAGYDAAKHDQAMTEKRISDLDLLLRQAVVIEDDAGNDLSIVKIGSTVVVDVDGDEERYTIVGAIEAKPTQGLISNESPVGRALLGLRPGEEALAAAPHGSTRLRLVRIER